MREPNAHCNEVTQAVVDAAVQVHRHLGPGHKEALYVEALERELRSRGHLVECERTFSVKYRGQALYSVGRVDMIVDDLVVVEAKVAKALLPLHRAQAISYLRLSGKEVALVLNFNVPLMKEGIMRVVLTRERP